MDASLKAGRPFPGHVTTALESFYKRGMVGWSGDSAVLFEEALASMPLTETQLKVDCNNRSPAYIHRLFIVL